MKLINKGYYWVRFIGYSQYTIGCYNDNSAYPWQVVGSDEIFKREEIEPIKFIDLEPYPIPK